MMTNIKFVANLLLVFVLFSCSNTKTNEESANTDETVAVAKAEVTPNATTTLDVEGMTCEMGCKAAIEKHLNKTEGVASCRVDFEKAIAVVDYDDTQISEDQIIAEIGEVADHAYTAKKHLPETNELAE